MDEIMKVKNLFNDSNFTIPFSMRIKTGDKYFSGLYKDLQIINGFIILVDSEIPKGILKVSVYDILDIQVFNDLNGKPIFLHDFESERGDV